MTHPKGTQHANHDNRCHRHDACDGVGVWAKRRPGWLRHRTAPGRTGHRTSRARNTGQAGSRIDSGIAFCSGFGAVARTDLRRRHPQRIREAALSYSDIAVRGGWPAIPAEAKFVPGAQGPHDDLLRQRLLISGDLATDQASGAYDEFVAESVKRFQLRHGLAATGTMTPRTLAALNVPVQKRIKQLEASLERLANMDFAFGQ